MKPEETPGTCSSCGFDITGMGRCPRCGQQRQGGNPRAESRLGRKTTWRSTTDWSRLALTSPMRGFLRDAVVAAEAVQPPAGTRKALTTRDLCSADGTLTARGLVLGISLLPLNRQIQILGLSLTDHHGALAQMSPERVVMDAYTRAGTPCCFTEGGIIFVVLYSLCFARLVRLGTDKWGGAGYTATMMGKTRTPVQSMMYSSVIVYQEFLPTNVGLENDLLGDIASVPAEQAMKNFEILRSWQSSDTWFPHGYVGMTPGLVQLVLERLSRASLVEIARLFFSDPYAYVKGWPDLTIVESGEVRLIEVKTTDRLHPGQIITMGEMKAAAGLSVTVLRVVA